MPRAFPPSFFQLAAGSVPSHPPLAGSRRADVVIVGGGFTGLSAAIHLAEAGADAVLLEADTVASGASGRNGGQIHSGLRRDVVWLEERFGFARAKELWALSEEAKALIRSLIVRFAIACDLRSGVIETLHKQSLIPDAAELVRQLRDRFGYEQVTLLDQDQTVAALGSERFVGAIHDRGGGHLDPYRFALGLARAATERGATIHEKSPAIGLRRDRGPVVETETGTVRAEKVIVATDGRSGPFETTTRRHMVGINSFILATEPLSPEIGGSIMPGGESAADSRFVVRYWRKTADGRLLFGGGESNSGNIPADIPAFVRPHLLEIYPEMKDVPVAHGWGGVVSVTAPRLPYVREIATDVLAAGGYSGQGVALAPFVGMLLAEAALGRPERMRAFAELPIPAIPGPMWIRRAMVAAALLQGRLSDHL